VSHVSSIIHSDGLQIIEVHQNEEQAGEPAQLFLNLDEAAALARDLLSTVAELSGSEDDEA
jgi:hypothetical protein